MKIWSIRDQHVAGNGIELDFTSGQNTMTLELGVGVRRYKVEFARDGEVLRITWLPPSIENAMRVLDIEGQP